MANAYLKKTLRFSIPIIIGQLGQLSMSVTDNLMVGGIGPSALAAAAIANSLFVLILAAGIGLTMGITPLTAMAVGNETPDQCTDILKQACFLNALAGVLCAGFIYIFAHAISYMNQPLEIVPSAIAYMQLLGFSMIPLMLFQTFRQFAEGIGFLKPAMLVTLAANLVNILVNWICIYGHLGVPAMGVSGAGMATLFSRIFMACCLGGIILTSRRSRKFRFALMPMKINFHIIKDLLSIGIPTAFQYLFGVSAFAAAAVIVGWMGTHSLAAHQIAMNLSTISFMMCMGISSAGTILVSQAMGKHQMHKAREAGFAAVILCTLFMGCAGMIFIAGRFFLPGLYVSDPAVRQIASSLLIIVAVFQISDGIQSVGTGILRGLPDMKIPTLITLLAYWIAGLPIGCLLAFPFGLGIYGIWWGLAISLSVSAISMMFRFHFKTKI